MLVVRRGYAGGLMKSQFNINLVSICEWLASGACANVAATTYFMHHPRQLDLPYNYCINSRLLALQHGISLTLKFLYFTEAAISSAISAGDCEAVARMPCGNRVHEHPPWPQQGTHQFVIEACENHCGWCDYRTKSANNLRVVSRFPPWSPFIHTPLIHRLTTS
jgi:hypothetical protein